LNEAEAEWIEQQRTFAELSVGWRGWLVQNGFLSQTWQF